jgi:hypothetical protein
LTLNAAAMAGQVDTEGERDYFAFDATAGQAYTVRVNASFSGAVRVRKRSSNGDFSHRLSDLSNLGGTPLAVAAGTELAIPLTIPNTVQFGNGVYIVEIAGGDAATGAYTVRVTSP